MWGKKSVDDIIKTASSSDTVAFIPDTLLLLLWCLYLSLLLLPAFIGDPLYTIHVDSSQRQQSLRMCSTWYDTQSSQYRHLAPCSCKATAGLFTLKGIHRVPKRLWVIIVWWTSVLCVLGYVMACVRGGRVTGAPHSFIVHSSLQHAANQWISAALLEPFTHRGIHVHQHLSIVSEYRTRTV